MTDDYDHDYDGLSHEIHAAVFYPLQRDYRGEFFWLSIGLISSSTHDTIEWRTSINCQYKGICIKTNGNGQPERPICRWDQDDRCESSQDKCEVHPALAKLEKFTSEHPSSLGNLSKTLFQSPDKPGYAPYIARAKDLKEKYRYIKAESELRNGEAGKPGEEVKLDDYKNCLPKDTTQCLVPLVQTLSGAPRWVGGVVVCADIKSEIWSALPRLRAAATSLLEPRRHIHTLASRRTDNVRKQLLDVLLSKAKKGDGWFVGECGVDSCEYHDSSKNFHDFDCRLVIEGFKFFNEDGSALTEAQAVMVSANDAFFKSLFYFGKLKWDNGRVSPAPEFVDAKGYFLQVETSGVASVALLKKFIQDKWGETLELLDNSYNNRHIPWPLLPGVRVLIALMEIHDLLSKTENNSKKKPLRLQFMDAPKDNPESTLVDFAIDLDENNGSRYELIDKVTNGGGSDTAPMLAKLLRCDLEYSDADLDLEQQQASKVILASSRLPVFGVNLGPVDKNRLHLNWLVKYERTVGNLCVE